MNRKNRSITMYIVLILFIIVAVRLFSAPTETLPEKTVTEFISDIQENKVVKIKYDDQTPSLEYQTEDGKAYETTLPEESRVNIYENYIQEKVSSGEIELSRDPIIVAPAYYEWLPSVIMLVVFIAIWYNMMNQIQGTGGGGRMNNFGKSRAKMAEQNEKNRVTFDDVAGLVEEKEELAEIVDFLKNPKKYTDMGARIPKGILMVGPPGTGKTYLSRAVAGEARVPFFSISGSDFVEMFVGVGASRVRDLFENAKKNAPCIIFIDEIDAVGRRRGAGLGGGHDEREQTLNQLLVEMDGFGKNEGIIVMAATNRADILDPAILRPGRFDRTVYVGYPDIRGREEVLKVHSKSKKLADDVDLGVIAKRTPGFTPADLENLMNESALLAARRGEKEIHMEDVNEASIKVQAGPAKKSRVVSEEEKRLTAIHESGHAVASYNLEHSDPVHMITIIPRGMAGGFTAYIPEEDISFITKSRMEDELVSLLGGRIAEQLVLGDISTGASNDIERATNIAKSMVTQYGMSDRLGAIKYGTDDQQVFLGRDLGRGQGYSENTAAEIDEEVARIINESYSKCKEILNSNMDKLQKLADVLMEKETIYRQEFESIMSGEAEELESSENTENVENTNI